MSSRKALLVGIDSYDPKRWPSLKCCTNDALTLSEVLEKPPFGFDVILLGDHEATVPEIYRTIMMLKKEDPEILLFYFAGHGVTTLLGTYLVTVDNKDFAEGIELPKLVELLTGDARPNQSVVVLLDCCHAGAAYIRPTNGHGLQYLSQEDISRAFSGLSASRAVLAACGPHDQVEESISIGHGIFTYYLLEGLRGAAADHEGRISVLSLQLFLTRPFAEMTKGKQPIFRGDIHGRLTLAEGLPPRLGPPLHEDIAKRLEYEAQDHLDRYSRLANRFDPQSWRRLGYEQAYRALTPIAMWFDEQMQKNPTLNSRPIFAQAYDGLISRRQALGTIEPGLRVEEGSIARSIGSGGYGEVWEVEGSDDKRFAFKIFHPHELRDIEKVARFRSGYDAMRMLKHDRIVKVTRFSECPLGFVMDMIPGQNLRQLEPATILDPLELTRLLVDIADTIHTAHDNHVIHRDIKPENIIASLGPDGVWTPHLTDFDLAWYSTANQKNTKSALGVVYYAAPEQHIAYNPRTSKGRRPTLDIFSFGQLMHFVFANSDPDPVKLDHNADNLVAAVREWGSGEAVAEIRDLYVDATKWEPADRIQGFDEILARLRDVVSELTHSSSGKILNESEFLSEIKFQYSGQPLGSRESFQVVDFLSASGNWRVSLVFFEVGSGRRLKRVLQARFSPTERVALTGIANERMRAILNSRVDQVLQATDLARRRAGKQGSYEVFVDFDRPDLSLKFVAATRNAIARVISALERS